MKKENLPKALQERIDAELLSGEDLLWVGQANTMRLMQKSTAKVSPIVPILVALELLALIATIFLGLAPILPLLL